MGDFVKGVLPGGLPPEVAAGVRLHRLIDGFSETHPAFRQSRGRVSATRRRYAGVLVDMFYDHFLARCWDEFHERPLATFTAEQYALMAAAGTVLPERLRGILPAMRADDWLASYRDAETIGYALDRMALRIRRDNPLPGAGEELLADYAGFEADFRAFLPDARAFARSHWQGAFSAGG